MNQLSPIVSVVIDAIATCVWMIGQLNAKALAHDGRGRSHFPSSPTRATRKPFAL
jgi:hypothetical protein